MEPGGNLVIPRSLQDANAFVSLRGGSWNQVEPSILQGEPSADLIKTWWEHGTQHARNTVSNSHNMILISGLVCISISVEPSGIQDFSSWWRNDDSLTLSKQRLLHSPAGEPSSLRSLLAALPRRARGAAAPRVSNKITASCK